MAQAISPSVAKKSPCTTIRKPACGSGCAVMMIPSTILLHAVCFTTPRRGRVLRRRSTIHSWIRVGIQTVYDRLVSVKKNYFEPFLSLDTTRYWMPEVRRRFLMNYGRTCFCHEVRARLVLVICLNSVWHVSVHQFYLFSIHHHKDYRPYHLILCCACNLICCFVLKLYNFTTMSDFSDYNHYIDYDSDYIIYY